MPNPLSVRADQLVYSNVEAEFSPVGRRGFQVWLCSPRLKEFQREIARRIEDFTWPAADAAEGRLTVRMTYCHIANVGTVIARTVPLTERDALKRQGRFHAHALVLDDAEFDRFHANPFAIFDRFQFQTSPAFGIEQDLWRTGLLPDAEELPLSESSCPAAEQPDVAELLPMLARWLDGPDDPRPLALPDHPDRVADWLRVLFQHLPPTLRRKASFDTLSSGQALTTLPFRFVGGFDQQTVRDWPYRRSYRLELKSGTLSIPPTPPENPLLDHFSQEWAGAITDEELQISDRLYRTWQNSTPDTASLSELADIPESLLAHALSAPGVDATWAGWINARLQADLPYPRLQEFVKSAADAWCDTPSPERLRQLVQPIPVWQLGEWLRPIVSQAPVNRELAGDVLAWANEQLRQGIKEEPVPQLLLMALAATRKVKELHTMFQRGGSWHKLIETWFREWFRSRMAQTELAQQPALYAAAILNDSLTREAELAEYDVLAAMLAPSSPLSEDDQLIAAANAFRAGDITALQKILRMNRVLQRVLPPIVDRPDASFEFTWGQPPFSDCPGACLKVPFSAAATPGMCALYSALENLPLAAQIIRSRAQVLARKCLPKSHVLNVATAGADQLYSARKWDRLQKELCTLTYPSDLRVFLVDHFHDKSRIADGDIPCQSITLSTGEPAIWVGWQIISNGNERDIFEKLRRVVTQVIHHDPTLVSSRIAALISAVVSNIR